MIITDFFSNGSFEKKHQSTLFSVLRQMTISSVMFLGVGCMYTVQHRIHVELGSNLFDMEFNLRLIS